jgi:hypothetical protein
VIPNAQGKFMKEVAILLLLALLLLNGCGSSSTTAQAAEGGIWGAEMLGGNGPSSGFSFNTAFTVNSNGTLSITSFQLLNTGTCFGSITPKPAGTLTDLVYNSADELTSGSFSFTMTSVAGDVVTLTSTAVTGVVDTNNNTLSGGSIVGNWTLTPASGSSKCVPVSSQTSFTMTQTAS